VLRAGRVVLRDTPAIEISPEELVKAMVGESVTPVRNAGELPTDAEPTLELRQVALGASEGSGLRGVDLKILPGEILGIAGVAGNGQRELADVVVGAARPDRGEVLVDSVVLPADPRKFRAAGVVSVAADPVREFVVPGLSVGEHGALWDAMARVARRLRFDVRRATTSLREASDRIGLRIAPTHRQLSLLSGGNIQRVLLTLAFAEPARLVVVSYPTRGLDVLTTETTRALLLAARDAGSAVLLISEDLDELLALSDRIAVLNHGRCTGVVVARDADRRSLGHLMTEEAA
jgi:ABC-type uncharacterized transport system ATPase subunit